MSRLRDDVAYILPMAVFMGFTLVGVNWPALFPLSYMLKTVVVGAILLLVWRQYTIIDWTHWPLGVLVGVVGVVQWVGMETLLMRYPALSWTRMMPNVQAEAFHPREFFQSPAALWCFIAVRWIGPTLVVPFMEERFWRDFLWRSIASPNDFKLQQIGEYDRSAFWGVCIAFAFVHVQWLTAIVWAIMIGILLLRTRSLGACIVAHATTNFLLGGYVLFCGFCLGKDQWFFW